MKKNVTTFNYTCDKYQFVVSEKYIIDFDLLQFSVNLFLFVPYRTDIQLNG